MTTDPGQSDGWPREDPTKNVLSLVEAAVRRLDDIQRLTTAHHAEIDRIRSEYDQRLREAETARIDAIRAVDVGAVNRAAEVSANQASILAAQVATSAETLRTQVTAAATASTVALAAALNPLQDAIADLRKAQYEAQGVKAQTTDSRLNLGAVLGVVSVLLVLIFGVFGLWIASNGGTP